jgi:hypothetical protein
MASIGGNLMQRIAPISGCGRGLQQARDQGCSAIDGSTAPAI